ncbi:hypothetical protein HBI70_074660 [Parastagonospora nodorum]|nr:hypothetical protein HBI70_074660 [Parastagonospora nodorum]
MQAAGRVADAVKTGRLWYWTRSSMRDDATVVVSVTQRFGDAFSRGLRQSRRRSSDAVCFSSMEPGVRGVKSGECSTASYCT